MTEFTLSFTVRNFAALETVGDASQENHRPFDSWSPDYEGEIIHWDISSIPHLKTKDNYEGYVSIVIKSLEPTPVVVGVDQISKLQPQKSGGHAALPTVHFEIKIGIQTLSKSLLKGLSVLIDSGNKTNPVALLEELEKNPEWLNILTDSKDPSLTLWKNRMVQMQQLQEGLQPLLDKMKSQGIPISELQNLTPEKALTLIPQRTSSLDKYETTPRIMRSLIAQYLEIFKGIAQNDPKIECNKEEVESFGTDLYEILKESINLVIRYFKYNQGQYWLEELEEGVGYFYIDNEVKMDNKGPLIPLARHKHTIDLLDQIFLLSISDWKSIRNDLENPRLLSENRLSIGRIFTQAEVAFTEGHFEAAITIAHVAFEASLNLVMDYFFKDKVPNVVPGKKIGFVQCLLERISLAGMKRDEYENLWRLIEGVPKPNRTKPRKPWDYEDGLIPIRNDLQHRTEFPEIEPRRVADYISAARKISRYMENWVQRNPQKSLANDCKEYLLQ